MSIRLQKTNVNVTKSLWVRCFQRRSSTLCGAILLVLSLVGVTTASGQDRAYIFPASPVAARVNVLALGGSVRVYTSREEIYLASVSTHERTYHLAKLVDSYSSDGNPILKSVLIEHRQLRMTLVRNPQCDTTGRRFFLSLDDTNIFDLSTRSHLLDHDADIIPCFLVIHEATHLKE
jgi:hypothetical protein